MIEITEIRTEGNTSVVELYCNPNGLKTLKTFVNYLKIKKEYETVSTDLKNILGGYDDI